MRDQVPRQETSFTPRVCVLMPVYNARRYLREAIGSILRQTFTDFELICIDDGSTDGSLTMLEDIQRTDARLRIISRPNTGICGALNDGLAVAHGQYIARMDADDWCAPERFALQVEHLDRHRDCEAVGTWVNRTDPYGSPAGSQEPPTDHDAIDAALLRGDGGALVHATLMLRADTLRAIGGWDTRFNWVEDFELFLRLTEAGRAANLPRHLYTYRRHLESVCSTRYEHMRGRVYEVLSLAYARRGLGTPPPLTELRPDLGRVDSAAQTYRNWACYAVQQRNAKIARRHALAAMRHEPWSLKTWKVMYWAMAA